jgi:hypothetical protein
VGVKLPQVKPNVVSRHGEPSARAEHPAPTQAVLQVGQEGECDCNSGSSDSGEGEADSRRRSRPWASTPRCTLPAWRATQVLADAPIMDPEPLADAPAASR